MADIRDLMGGGGAPPGGGQQQTPAGMMPKPPAPAGGGPSGMSSISSLMKAQPNDGMKKIATTMVALSRKLMELVLPVFGSHTEEGREILKAIGAVGKMTKGVELGDMSSLLQSLNASLPPGMKPSGQGDMAQMLAQLTKGGAGGAPQPQPQPGAAPAGASPGASPMPPKPM